MNYFKQLRMKQGLSQAEVARYFSYGSPQFISSWERDISLPPPEAVADLEKLYKVKKGTIAKYVVEAKTSNYRKELEERYGL